MATSPFGAFPGPSRLDAALAVLRIVTGIVFTAHGAQKIFVYGFGGVTGGFTQMGIPLAQVIGPTVAVLEFLGGMALILGLFTWPVAALLAVDMVAATFLVHWAGGFFIPEGYEFTMTLFGCSMALLLAGPGAYSVDAMLLRRRAGRA